MTPQKRLLSGLISLAIAMSASLASAQTFLGSSADDAKRLLPADASPSTSGDAITYYDIKMGDVTWSEVTLRFNAAHRLTSLSLRTHQLAYDVLRTRALAQLQLYAADQVRQHSTMGTVAGTVAADMQIRICTKGDDVEMTYESASHAL